MKEGRGYLCNQGQPGEEKDATDNEENFEAMPPQHGELIADATHHRLHVNHLHSDTRAQMHCTEHCMPRYHHIRFTVHTS